MSITYKDIYEQFNRQRVDKVANDPDYTGTALTSGNIAYGKRYEFIAVGTGADFTNVGCDADPVAGDYFYATTTAPPTLWGSGTSIYAGMSPVDIISNEIANCKTKFTSIAEFCDTTFEEDDAETMLAMKYYTMYLLYLRSQNEKQGEGEYKMAISLLTELYGNGVIDYFQGNRRTDTEKKATSEKIAEVSVIDWDSDDYDEIFADDDDE